MLVTTKQQSLCEVLYGGLPYTFPPHREMCHSARMASRRSPGPTVARRIGTRWPGSWAHNADLQELKREFVTVISDSVYLIVLMKHSRVATAVQQRHWQKHDDLYFHQVFQKVQLHGFTLNSKRSMVTLLSTDSKIHGSAQPWLGRSDICSVDIS